MIEEFIQLCIATIRIISQSEILCFICEVFSIVVGYEEGGWWETSFIPRAGVTGEADDDVGPLTDPVHHELLVTVIEVGSL